jgi:alkanesulfonate monooxygenase SsuD/methylene tetrahydromethanopterin reductase-like flavin-dependent oxidoreductase (luciferase family)
MKFGLFQSVQLPEPGAQVQYYQEALQQVRWAEQLGFHSVWFTEHHFSRHGIVPASLTVLAYLAGVTTSTRPGTAVAGLPFHNPIQLAEQAATVDLLSNGRLDLGVGRGYQWGEFHKFDVPMEEATRRFEEAMEVMTRAWTATEPFDHRGEFWSFHDMTLHPRPVQTPHPPLWVAASSQTSMDRVVRHNWNLLIGQGESFQQVAAQVEYFHSAVEEAGFTYSPDKVIAARAMYTARRQEQARRDTEAPFMWFKRRGQEVGAPQP